jgi:hypothetical protein
MKRIDFGSPEWAVIREMMQREYDDALKHLVNPHLSEGEYHQWRGRALLAYKVLGLENTPNHLTD